MKMMIYRQYTYLWYTVFFLFIYNHILLIRYLYVKGEDMTLKDVVGNKSAIYIKGSTGYFLVTMQDFINEVLNKKLLEFLNNEGDRVLELIKEEDGMYTYVSWLKVELEKTNLDETVYSIIGINVDKYIVRLQRVITTYTPILDSKQFLQNEVDVLCSRNMELGSRYKVFFK